MKPHSDPTGVIYLQLKDTVTTDTGHNGQWHKKDKQQQHYCRDGNGSTCSSSKDNGVKTRKLYVCDVGIIATREIYDGKRQMKMLKKINKERRVNKKHGQESR